MALIEIFLILSGVALLVIAINWGNKQKADADSPPPPPLLSDTSYENSVKLQKALTELVNELHTLSRDVTLDMEQKLSELKELLQLADTKLEELSAKETGGHNADGAPHEWSVDNDGGARLYDHEPQIVPSDADAVPSSSNRYQQIYDMADEGLPIDDIARSMEMGKGEIQLILSLRGKGPS